MNNDFKSQLRRFSNLVSTPQLTVILSCIKGEEGIHFRERVAEIAARLEECPTLYEQEYAEEKKAYFHYFLGRSDWWVMEYDGENTAFGFCCLNGDVENAELGYIHMPELRDVHAELDLYFNVTPLSDIKQKLRDSVYDDPSPSF